MNEIKEKLEDAIKNSLEVAAQYSAGSNERKQAIEQIDTLYKLKMEEDKLEAEIEKAKEQGKLENAKLEAEKKKAKEQKILNWVNVGVQAGSTLVMIVAYNCWLNKGYRFEENGTIRSPHLRNLVSRILPKFK